MQIGDIIPLHDTAWYERQKIAGQCVAKCLKTTKQIVQEFGVSCSKLTGKDLEQICHNIFLEYNCQPTFLNYKGFPGKICLSRNKELVHGIPKDEFFQIGDVIKIDLGATFEGAIADAALTVIYGLPKDRSHQELINLCQKSLSQGISAVQIGKKLGVIGNAVYQTVRRQNRFSLVTRYGGHGLDYNRPHAPPFVSNKTQSNEGPIIQAEMSLAIEPMLVLGDNFTRVSEKDGWTVLTNGIGAHFEHTIFIHHDGKIEIMTEWEKE